MAFEIFSIHPMTYFNFLGLYTVDRNLSPVRHTLPVKHNGLVLLRYGLVKHCLFTCSGP